MTLLLVGMSTRAAAESAVGSGYDVQALDAFGDMDLSAACPSFSLLHDFQDRYADMGSTTVRLYHCSMELEFDEVIYGSGFENHPECIEGWERSGKTVLGNDAEALRAVRDWEGLFDFLDHKGIPHPESQVVADLSRFDLRSLDPEEFIVKPSLSGGGHGIHILKDLMMAGSWGDRIDKPVLLQERLEGVLASASFVSGKGGCEILSTTLQLVGNQFSPFRYGGNIAPLDAPQGVRTRMGEIAKRIAAEYNLKGSNGVDFMLTNDGTTHVLEVNPRIQGSLEVVERTSGIGVFDAHVRSCRGMNPPHGAGKEKGFWGRRVVFAPRDMVTVSLNELAFTKDVPRPGTPVKAGGPICTVLAHSDSVLDCKRQLAEGEKRVISRLEKPG